MTCLINFIASTYCFFNQATWLHVQFKYQNKKWSIIVVFNQYFILVNPKYQ